MVLLSNIAFLIIDLFVSVYDVLTGKIETELAGHRACVRDAAWHPHRSEIVSTSVGVEIIFDM